MPLGWVVLLPESELPAGWAERSELLLPVELRPGCDMPLGWVVLLLPESDDPAGWADMPLLEPVPALLPAPAELERSMLPEPVELCPDWLELLPERVLPAGWAVMSCEDCDDWPCCDDCENGDCEELPLDALEPEGRVVEPDEERLSPLWSDWDDWPDCDD